MNKDTEMIVEKNFLNKEEGLSTYATLSSKAVRFKEESADFRTDFSRDVDRIIHAASYTRYLNKTQVFSFNDNDLISTRIVHVQLVSKIARTIGRCLGLNEDLIEAIALGHDIGHTPLGHTGEAILNDISKEKLNEIFLHNVQSVRNYMYLEKSGDGLNLTLQVLDGILCHNGEMLSNVYYPKEKTKEEFLEEFNACYTDYKVAREVAPMTLEGCIVRISDIIGYIGRDIEDAIKLGVVKRSDIPDEIVSVLGSKNSEIVNTIILDIVNNSLGKPYIKLSDEVFNAIKALKDFNYKNIYYKANTKEDLERYRLMMNKLFDAYLLDVKTKNKGSIIYKTFLNFKKEKYLNDNKPERIVIDFISGMTDEFFIRCYNDLCQ